MKAKHLAAQEQVSEEMESDVAENENSEKEEELKEAKTNYEQTRKDFLDGEEKYKQEWLALKNKKTEAGYDTEKYKRGYDQLKPASDNFAKVYKETFNKMPSQEHYDIEPLIKQQAEKYQKVKGRQFRPFPSRMRTHRKNVAKFLISFADNAKKGIAAEKEVKELDQYLLSEGKSRGLDLSQDRLIEKIKEDEHLEHPGEKEKLEKESEKACI